MDGPNRILISLCRIVLTDLITTKLILGFTQNRLGRKIKGIKDLHQLGKTKIEEDGSKLENKLFIMFI